MRYSDYIQSEEWRAKRKLALHRDNYECRTCDYTCNLQVHHRHYKNFGNESLSDLTTLCEECHLMITILQDIRRGRFMNEELKVREANLITAARLYSKASTDKATAEKLGELTAYYRLKDLEDKRKPEAKENGHQEEERPQKPQEPQKPLQEYPSIEVIKAVISEHPNKEFDTLNSLVNVLKGKNYTIPDFKTFAYQIHGAYDDGLLLRDIEVDSRGVKRIVRIRNVDEDVPF